MTEISILIGVGKKIYLMLSTIPEKNLHFVRWVLLIGLLGLILSLFYDPISHHLTEPNNLLSPFRDLSISAEKCIKVQGECLKLQPYPLGTRVFWGIVIPSAIMTVLIFGHETWRRICPLYFLSQISRALGLKPLLQIDSNPWLVRNHFYVQFALLFIGLNCRILFVNSTRPIFGLFLLLTIVSAITVVFLYGGRSWCHYVCPFGAVQTVFTGPRGLLGSEAHKAPPGTITQSMCRTVDQTTGQEQTACVSCKSPCLDIDAEKTYWEQLTKPGRKLLQYGYLGLVIGYFVYYWLYAGNLAYYFSGAWTHEENQLASLFQPGFYLFGQPIPIPKLIAAPLTIAFFIGISYLICSKLEKAYKVAARRKHLSVSQEQVLHRVFSICTFVAFNAFFIYGGRPEILRLPIPLQFLFNGLVVLVSSFWLYRTWGRSAQQYTKESLADKLRRQLNHLPFDFSQFLEGYSLQQLQTDELYLLAKALPDITQQDRLQIYKGVLQEAIQAGHVNYISSLKVLQQMRQKLGVSDEQHYQILVELGGENQNLHLLDTRYQQLPYLARTQLRGSRKSNLAGNRTKQRKS